MNKRYSLHWPHSPIFKTNPWHIAVALMALGAAAQADVKMPLIFGDHMVLQQQAKLPVWGTADAGEKVTITIGDKTIGDKTAGKKAATATTTTGTDGAWRVDLAPLPVSDKPTTMTVEGKNKLTFTDVVVGDVWVCSGQSNMEFGLTSAHNHAEVLPKADDPLIRVFIAYKPQVDPPQAYVNHWMVCTPEQIRPFSAVGYFFGRDLRENLHRPIGLIGSYVGGTPVEAWTGPRDRAGETPEQAAAHDKLIADFPAAEATYQAALAKWNQEVGIPFETTMNDWRTAAAKARAAAQPTPAMPPRPTVPPPRGPGDPNGAGGLFHYMVLPHIPYAIKGAIWYQGEANAGNAQLYHEKFSNLITSWRRVWAQGDFPFLFVQLASFQAQPTQDWPALREAQLQTLSLPHTGMATAVDIGDPRNIHPQDKLDVGKRLALAARHVAYGQELVYSGPIYDSMKVEGGAIRVSFTQTGSGLVIGAAPWVPAGLTPLPTDKLAGFTIAGADKNWVPADAKIDGKTVVVSSPQVPHPEAVRYGWADAPQINLYNKEALPASPFRTDDWPSGIIVTPPAIVKLPAASPAPAAPAASPAQSPATSPAK